MLLDFFLRLIGVGRRCPDCKAWPGMQHNKGCPTSRWDGGIWA